MSVLAVVAPVYVAVAVGYLAVRAGVVPAAALPVLGGFVVNIALPGLLFGALATRDVTEVARPVYLVAYAGGSLVAMVAGYALTMRLGRGVTGTGGTSDSDGIGSGSDVDAGRDLRTRAAYVALASGTSNSGYVGLPILMVVMPAQAPIVFGMNVLVENLLTIPLGMALAERAAGTHVGRVDLVKRTAGTLARSPMINAIVAGVAVSALGVPVPDVVQRTATMFGQATTAPALFIIGGYLVGRSLRGRARTVAPLLLGKLVVHPLAVGALVVALGAAAPTLGMAPLDPTLRSAAVFSAAAPTISIIAVLAARHGQEETISAASFAVTLGAALTLTGVLFALREIPGTGL